MAGLQEIKMFLKWRMINSKTTKDGKSLYQSTLTTYFKKYQMVYHVLAGVQLPQGINNEHG
jgi:hypothetical protein